MLPRPDFVEADKLLDPAFVELRAEADAWQAARIAFMTRRLKEGRTPTPTAPGTVTPNARAGLPAMSVSEHYKMRSKDARVARAARDPRRPGIRGRMAGWLRGAGGAESSSGQATGHRFPWMTWAEGSAIAAIHCRTNATPSSCTSRLPSSAS